MSILQQWQLWRIRLSSAAKSASKHQDTTKTLSPLQQALKFPSRKFLLVGISALLGAIATALGGPAIESIERELQTQFTRLRPKVVPPPNIVILAIDDYSLNQSERFSQTPETLSDLETIQRWPWKREAYAIAVQKLLDSGAKVVALDLILDSPSIYGDADDAALSRVLQAYPGRVTLAALYEENDHRAGGMVRLTQPTVRLKTEALSIGSINYPLDSDGRIHRFSEQFTRLWAKNNPDLAQEFEEFIATVPSFDRATLQAAGFNPPKSKGDRIFFYGPPKTFEAIPFADVLDPENWRSYLQGGEYFRDKIVLIGPTSESLQDFHPTPIAQSMSGVEIHANAIASLLEGRSLAEFPSQKVLQGLLVFVIVVTVGGGASLSRLWPVRLAWTGGGAIAWLGVGYLIFVIPGGIVPGVIPAIAIGLCGAATAVEGALAERSQKRQLRQTMKHYASSPIVREIISQQEDLQDLLDERERELRSTPLGGRYQILRKLSSGGFGETYIAQDLQRPGNPECVVKQLRPTSNNPKHWQLAKRLIVQEAEVLEKLGKHDQIPQLLAYFEDEDEFYLVEEFVDGHLLEQEFPVDVPLSEAWVAAILQELLEILVFIHRRGVIHRDVKPENIIRRKSDGKLVLLDFGAVKAISTQLNDGEKPNTSTIAIGSQGYTPREQSVGHPKFSSDIYALGMLALRALTLLHPAKLPEDPETGEVIWQDRAIVSPALGAILNKMIRSDFRDRYPSAAEVLDDLRPLMEIFPPEQSSPPEITAHPLTTTSITPTAPPTNLTSLPTEIPTEPDIQLD